MFFLMTKANSALSSSAFCVQIINFREPVTLDFLDAELEDNNKEEVKITPFKRHNCKLMYILCYVF